METFSYIKKRKSFGKQPMFCETPTEMLDSINPDMKLAKCFILRNPVHKDSQATLTQSECYINTKRVKYTTTGANHAEGGWPKEVNFADEDQTTRHRRRIEREDDYVNAIIDLYPSFEHLIKQNNCIEMYQMYFNQMANEPAVEKIAARFVNTYKDEFERPISSINWSFEDEPRLVTTYCNRQFPITGPVNKILKFAVWSIEFPLSPAMELYPPTPCWVVDGCPAHPKLWLGGLNDGRVCIFDIRVRKEPIAFSPAYLANRDPVCAIVFMQTRTNNEFFSGSSDGKCMWWDLRDLSLPTDEIIMVPKLATPLEQVSMANAHPVSCLQFERSIPTRFLCGTDTGLLINVNRKGKSHQELMSGVKIAHNGPVKTALRSPTIVKMILTCGDWAVHVFSDDIHSTPILTGIRHRHQITDVAWCPNRVSSYMSACQDGKLRYWDLLRRINEPIMTLPVSHAPLSKLKTSEDGRFVAIGDQKGAMYLVSLSESMANSGENDKLIMGQNYERETKREHILESRLKEIRLKMMGGDESSKAPVEVIDEAALDKQAEDEYRKMVIDEIRRMGYTPAGRDTGKGNERKR